MKKKADEEDKKRSKGSIRKRVKVFLCRDYSFLGLLSSFCSVKSCEKICIYY
jgi:hypothetical protein